MKRQNSATYVAILALIVSSISLWLSYQNRQYDRLVAYEQRRQEVRQLFLEGELLSEKLERSILEHVKADKTPELREDAAKIWKIATEIHQEMTYTVASFQALPATSGTKARLELEKLFADQLNMNKKLRELLEMAKKGHGVNHEQKK
jgi:hypothetical protein